MTFLCNIYCNTWVMQTENHPGAHLCFTRSPNQQFGACWTWQGSKAWFSTSMSGNSIIITEHNVLLHLGMVVEKISREASSKLRSFHFRNQAVICATYLHLRVFPAGQGEGLHLPDVWNVPVDPWAAQTDEDTQWTGAPFWTWEIDRLGHGFITHTKT